LIAIIRRSTHSQLDMITKPPFDPPYKTQLISAQGERWVEVLADGTEIDTVAPSATTPGVSGTLKKSAAPDDKSRAAAAMLNVPFAEKDEAKRLGARWDSAKKKWYAPSGADLARFSRWLAGDT
jgi:hypothetical protein